MIIDKIQLKRGFSDVLAKKLVGENKPLAGEPIFEVDTNKIKIGDGEHDYIDLDYIGESEIIFNSRYEFPSVGKDNILYIAVDENNAYI